MSRPKPRPRPWFPPDWPNWHYPDPNHPATLKSPHGQQTRLNPCPLCGAPPKATCVTKHGDIYDGHHKARHPAT
jgi:hypothetical protein